MSDAKPPVRMRDKPDDRRSPAPRGADVERKIYVLPVEQVERIKEYQHEYGIASEVEAVRRLLDLALEMRDTVESLLKKLKSRWQSEKDLRILAREILAAHSRVKSIHFSEDGLDFTLSSDERGRIDQRGDIYTGVGFDSWDQLNSPKPPRSGWNSPSKTPEPDDDIPF